MLHSHSSDDERSEVVIDRTETGLAVLRRFTAPPTVRRPAALHPSAIEPIRVSAWALTIGLHLGFLLFLILPPDPAPLEPSGDSASASVEDPHRLAVVFLSAPALTPAEPPPPMPRPPERVRRPTTATPPPVPPPIPSTPALPLPVASAMPTADHARITPRPVEAPAPAVAPGTPASSDDDAQRPKPASAAQVRREQSDYIRALMAWLLRYRTYPDAAKKDKVQGVVHVRFTIDRDGNVLSASIERSPGFAALEHAALEVLQQASPVPPIPASMRMRKLTITLPIEYALTTH